MFADTSKQICLKIMNDLSNQGVERIILGYTELPLLLSQDDIGIHYLIQQNYTLKRPLIWLLQIFMSLVNKF